jgi:acyl carrier protein
MNGILSDNDTKAVLKILVDHLSVQETELTPEARFEEDLGSDSLMRVEISMAVEDYFNIAIPDEKLEKVETVRDLFEALADVPGMSPRRQG